RANSRRDRPPAAAAPAPPRAVRASDSSAPAGTTRARRAGRRRTGGRDLRSRGLGLRVLASVPLPVIAAHDAAPPGFVVEVPAHRRLETGRERRRRAEAEPLADLVRGDRVAAGVAWPVADVLDEGARRAALRRRAACEARRQARRGREGLVH